MAHQEFAERDFVVKISVPLSPDIFSILPRYICRNAPNFATNDGDRCIHSPKFQIRKILTSVGLTVFWLRCGFAFYVSWKATFKPFHVFRSQERIFVAHFAVVINWPERKQPLSMSCRQNMQKIIKICKICKR